MNTAELTGDGLDRWVARALGAEAVDGKFVCAATGDATPLGCGYYMSVEGWKPSTNPAQGQPIIERDNISVIQVTNKPGVWTAMVGAYWGYEGPEADHEAEGPTALIAAMRAKVASVFGPEVPAEGAEIPRSKLPEAP